VGATRKKKNQQTTLHCIPEERTIHLPLHGDLKVTQSTAIPVTPTPVTKQILSAYSEQVKQEMHVHCQFRMLGENMVMDIVQHIVLCLGCLTISDNQMYNVR
jgi:hypothetical protein